MSVNDKLKIFFATFGVESDATKKAYHHHLNKLDDQDFLMKRLDQLMLVWKPIYGEKLPSIAEILGGNLNESAETAIAWQFFLANMCNNYKFEPIPDWVYTVKKHLGEKRCEDVLEDDLVWLKKEFDEIYPLVAKGKIETLTDPKANRYLKQGNVTIMLDQEVFVSQGLLDE